MAGKAVAVLGHTDRLLDRSVGVERAFLTAQVTGETGTGLNVRFAAAPVEVDRLGLRGHIMAVAAGLRVIHVVDLGRLDLRSGGIKKLDVRSGKSGRAQQSSGNKAQDQIGYAAHSRDSSIFRQHRLIGGWQ
jgi:hypothetical protein